MERRFAVHARARRQALIAALALASGTVSAAPKSGEARVQFDKGVAAYTKGDYPAASEALGASFVLEADVETLFAWAQTERKLGHCDRAIELYSKLLGMDMPDENKQAVRIQINECKAIVAEQKAKEPKTATKTKEPARAKLPAKTKAEPLPEPPKPELVAPPPAPVLAPAPAVAPAPAPGHHDETRAWWKDPVGGGLVVGGTVALGAGIVFLVQGSAADSDKNAAMSYSEYKSLADRAESRGRIGVIGVVVGTGLIAGGVGWYLTHKPSEQKLTALVLPSGGGVAMSGRF